MCCCLTCIQVLDSLSSKSSWFKREKFVFAPGRFALNVVGFAENTINRLYPVTDDVLKKTYPAKAGYILKRAQFAESSLFAEEVTLQSGAS